MPPLSALADVTLDPAALVLTALAAVLYGLGVRAVRRKGGVWPVRRTIAFGVLGLGSELVVCLGFLGAHSTTLRWAFVLRVTLLLLAVPPLAAFGRPLELLRAALGAPGRQRVDAAVASVPVRLLGSPIVAPIVPFVLFFFLLTPAAGAVRVSPVGEAAASVLLPLLGLTMTLSFIEDRPQRTGVAFTAEFLISFAELVLDAVPGILMRLATTVLDGMPHLAAGVPGWYPNPLRDQQLAGDLLWFIAEVGDLPALIVLFVRWQRSDRREARSYDDLTDEEYAALAAEHLKRREG